MRSTGSCSGAALARLAAQLGRTARTRKSAGRLAANLVLFTDPARLGDPLAAARSLPRGAAVVHRTFGRADAEAQTAALAKTARVRGLVLLIGRDDRLAERVGAHGVHLPQRDLHRAARLRARHPRWILTVAVHDARAVAAARAPELDACFLSPAFPSGSPSAKRPLGPLRVAALVRRARLPVYALGGIDPVAARRLGGAGVAGIAGIEAFRT